MDGFAWNEEWDLGIEVIDSQHRAIATEANRVYQATSRDNRGEIEEALRRLIFSVHEHLEFEEELMEAGSYHDTDAHRVKHGEVVKQLDRNFAHFIRGELTALALVEELKMWFTIHMRYDDRDYAPYLLEQLGQMNWKKRTALSFRKLFGRRSQQQALQ